MHGPDHYSFFNKSWLTNYSTTWFVNLDKCFFIATPNISANSLKPNDDAGIILNHA